MCDTKASLPAYGGAAAVDHTWCCIEPLSLISPCPIHFTRMAALSHLTGWQHFTLMSHLSHDQNSASSSFAAGADAAQKWDGVKKFEP
jgi:hypothetical protein